MEKYDVVCLGFAVQDIVMSGIPGNALECDSIHATKTLIAAGGDAVNQAVVLSHLGLHTTMIANFGKDQIGRLIEEDLKRNDVDITYAVRDGIEKTGFSVVVIKEDGQRSCLVGKGSGNVDLSSDEIPEELLNNTRALSIGSLFFLKKLDGKAAAMLFRKAREKGVFTFADMTVDAYGIGSEGIEDVYPHTDYLLPSYEEAVYVTGKKDMDEIADYFLKRGVGTLVLKLGDKGCFVKNKENSFFTAPYIVDPVDTTGCGDAFCAGFISGILKGMTLEESADYASAVGAINTGMLGAHEAVNNDKQVQKFMGETSRRDIKW